MRIKRSVIPVLLLLFWLIPGGRLLAVLNIEVTQGLEAGMPIAVVPFEWRGQGAPPVDLRKLIADDLYRSGLFDVLPVEDYLSRPSDHREVHYKDWRLIRAEALVVGRVTKLSADQFEVQFRLFDIFGEKQMTGLAKKVDRAGLRKFGHQTSDLIFKALTGKSGAFDSRIAYVNFERVASDGPKYQLIVADSDGFNPMEILSSSNPVLSPSWSPDGRYLAYVSFEDKLEGTMSHRPKVVVQDIFNRERFKVSDFPGLNGAPAWSPDGRRLALSLSHEGDPEIYVMDINSRRLQRLTHHSAIDTEPAWAPNGRSLIFTSNRSGQSQIYRTPASGGKAVRLTFEGRENMRGSFSSDGKNLVMVTNHGKGYQIGVFSLSDKKLRILTDGPFDESPTFAPNGSMILYATRRAGREVVEYVSTAGHVRQLLPRFLGGGQREPAWAPLNR